MARRQKAVKKVPKGTSDYQAAWIIAEDGEDDDDDDEVCNVKSISSSAMLLGGSKWSYSYILG